MKRERLRIYQYRKSTEIAFFRKALSLPVYLHRLDDFAMFVAKHCGCHAFHINYRDSDEITRRLCDIEIKEIGKKSARYRIPLAEDINRLALFLDRNRKARHDMKETTSAGRQKNAAAKATSPPPEHMYG